VNRHHLVLQMRPGERIECTERLVEKQDLGLHGKCPGKADALLHAARDLRRAFVLGMPHMDQFEAEHRPFMPLLGGLGRAEHLIDRELHILIDSEPG
jgi:hypothetical protein